jgi:hypothetical protein
MTVAETITNLSEGQKTIFTLIEKLSKDNKPEATLVVEQKESEPLTPKRAESPRRRHVFYDVESFKAYLLDYGKDTTVVYGNPQSGVVHAVIDEEAKDGFEIIRFEPMLHPLWRPWEAILSNGAVMLDQFVDFVAKNRRSITVPSGAELLMMFSQIKASTHAELQRGRGKKAVNGLMITTEIQGVSNKELIELPDAIEISLPIFVRTSPRYVEIDITVGLKGDDIQITLAAADLLEAKFKAFEEMFKTLESLSNMTLTLGEPAHADWNYLK